MNVLIDAFEFRGFVAYRLFLVRHNTPEVEDYGFAKEFHKAFGDRIGDFARGGRDESLGTDIKAFFKKLGVRVGKVTIAAPTKGEKK